MIHKLKTWEYYFKEVLNGSKTYEVRKDDRGGYAVGDKLLLEEYKPDKKEYTGRNILVDITHVLQGGEFGLEKGYVVMAIKKPEVLE